jgi:chemotaxis protein methyltransferase CheR
MSAPALLLTAPPAAPLDLSVGDLGAMLDVLARRTGVDLTGQRLAMLARRAAQQIAVSGARTAAGYLALLRTDAAEPWRLLERLTIKVSRFFRNPETFATIGARVLPDLRWTRRGRELRVWSAGCGCGEEPYGLAMLCAAGPGRFSVLGTDVDRAALARARAATYRRVDVEHVPAALAARHLAPRGDDAVAVRPELARHVRFDAHDLASAAAVAGGHFDLVACRNVLIYYVAERQAEILGGILRALAPGGYLVLGEAEWPVPSIERRLEVVDRVDRVFRLAAAPADRSS